MKIECEWNEKLHFTAAHSNGMRIYMDAAKPFGDEKAPTPKHLLLSSLCGCAGMDIISVLNKFKQAPIDFRIEAEAEIEANYPHELVDIKLEFIINGPCDPDRVLDAVELSQTKYCAISSMLSRGTSINYNIFLNGKMLASGEADFHKYAHQYHPKNTIIQSDFQL